VPVEQEFYCCKYGDLSDVELVAFLNDREIRYDGICWKYKSGIKKNKYSFLIEILKIYL
jgi:hypothetical protein